MPALANPKWEQFCLLVVQGHSATRAYMLAGYSKDEKAAKASASRLLANVNVKARVLELREQSMAVARQHTEITLNDLIGMAAYLYKNAAKAGQYGASVAALRELGILTGKRIERKEVGGAGEFDRLTDEQLIHIIEGVALEEGEGGDGTRAPEISPPVRE